MFPGCIILKNDPGYFQGIPDLVIFYRDRWAMLEVKSNASATHRPNQDYLIELLNGMSYAAFIYPSNEQDILLGLQQALDPGRDARLVWRE